MRPLVFLLTGLVGSSVLCPFPAHAHEKWFVDASQHPASWTLALRFPEIAGVVVALMLTAIAGITWRALNARQLIPGPEVLGADEDSRMKFYGLVPLILGVHLAVPLFVLALRGDFF